MKLIDELTKVINILVKRLREWYELYYPELSHKLNKHEEFVNEITNNSRDQLIKKYNLESEMGADLGSRDVEAIQRLAKNIFDLYSFKKSQLDYIDTIANEIAPHTVKVIGTHITARLIAIAGSLRNLVMMPASTVQVLGAEKAFFRHLIQGSKMPKYGVIMQHPSFNKVPRNKRGKHARDLAGKISISIKQDYFSDKNNN